jgi:hypothetical protein
VIRSITNVIGFLGETKGGEPAQGDVGVASPLVIEQMN